MTAELPLFDHIYPNKPGFKERTTAREAAEAIAPSAPTLRAAALRIIRRVSDGATADEVAKALKLSVLTIRPRCSELRRFGLITDSGARRENRSGKKAIVWIITADGIATANSGSGG